MFSGGNVSMETAIAGDSSAIDNNRTMSGMIEINTGNFKNPFPSIIYILRPVVQQKRSAVTTLLNGAIFLSRAYQSLNLNKPPVRKQLNSC
jgi:hypothetical protein